MLQAPKASKGGDRSKIVASVEYLVPGPLGIVWTQTRSSIRVKALRTGSAAEAEGTVEVGFILGTYTSNTNTQCRRTDTRAEGSELDQLGRGLY